MVKAAHWTTVVYPESLREDWLKQLENIGCEISVSPLHDQDKWTADDEKKNPNHKEGTLKKAHYHIILCFNGPKTDEQLKSMLKALVTCENPPYPERIQSDVPSAEDYQTHDTLDCEKKKKVKYDKSKVIHLNGFDASRYPLRTVKKEQKSYMPQILQMIQEYDIREFWDICVIASAQENPDDLVAYIESHSFMVTKLIDSRRWKKVIVNEKGEKCIGSDPETGEAQFAIQRVWIGDKPQISFA